MNCRLLGLALMALAVCGSPAEAQQRIKDVAALSGVRENPLIGYGLVVGLDGSGDQATQTPYTTQSLRNMLTDLGVTIPPNVSIQPKNVAAVTVQAQLPPFVKPGQTIDVTVASVGNAKSLRGGSLLMTPLKGADGQIYALAQGNVTVGGLGVSSEGSSVTVNVPSSGRIPNGAIVEREVRNPFHSSQNPPLLLNLHRPDFTTALRVAEAINAALGSPMAQALDAATVEVTPPRQPQQRVAYMATLENIEVQPGTAPARVVVNSRTGTVVIGQNVRVGPAAVTHGNLTVTIAFNPIVSQPNPLAGGRTVVVPQADIQVEQEKKPMFLFDAGVSLGDIVSAVNQVGVSASDLVAILEALKTAGALGAELIVI